MKGMIFHASVSEKLPYQKAIIDKNARIGHNVSIGMGEIPPDGDYGYYHIVDRIYVITKNAIIPDNTVI